MNPLPSTFAFWLCLLGPTCLLGVNGFLNSNVPMRNHSPLHAATTLSKGESWKFPSFSNDEWMPNPFSAPKHVRIDWANPFSILSYPKPKVTNKQPTFASYLDRIGDEWQQFIENMNILSTHDVSATLDSPRNAVVSASKREHPTPMASEGDWSAFISRESGHVYYFHRLTGESRWEPPTATFPTVSLTQIAPSAIPIGVSARNLLSNFERRPQRVATRGDWSQYLSQDDRVFYYHRVTGKSQWDPPRVFRPPPTRVRSSVKQTTTTNPSVLQNKPGPLPLATQGDWSAYWDASYHRAYYFHRVTGESVWEPPADFPEVRQTNIPKAVMRKTNNQDSTTTAASPWDLDQVTRAMWTSFQELVAQWESLVLDPTVSTTQKPFPWQVPSTSPTFTFSDLFSSFDTLLPTSQKTQVSRKSIVPRKTSRPPFPLVDFFGSDLSIFPPAQTSRAPKSQPGTSFPQFSFANFFATDISTMDLRNPSLFPFGGSAATGRKATERKRGARVTRPFFVHISR
jgi:WW domain